MPKITKEQEIKEILEELKANLAGLYGDRFKSLILYGSWARGEARDGSDIDLAVVLEGKIVPGKEIDRMIDIVTELNLKYNVLLSVYPISEKDYQKVESPLLLRVHQEGRAV